MDTNVCVICGKEFPRPVHRPNAVTCGVACNNQRQNGLRREKTKEKYGTAKLRCAYCRKWFERRSYKGGFDQVYCSVQCQHRNAAREYARKQREANPHWTLRSRIKYYMDGNWAKAIERANGYCEKCGEAINGKFYVHHRDGSGETDSPNHDLDNLWAVHPKCHTKIHEINFRIINGELFVTGEIFDMMNVKEVRVL